MIDRRIAKDHERGLRLMGVCLENILSDVPTVPDSHEAINYHWALQDAQTAIDKAHAWARAMGLPAGGRPWMDHDHLECAQRTDQYLARLSAELNEQEPDDYPGGRVVREGSDSSFYSTQPTWRERFQAWPYLPPDPLSSWAGLLLALLAAASALYFAGAWLLALVA